jgi:aminoglycoside phosphotransferase (APT) family kinase protein
MVRVKAWQHPNRRLVAELPAELRRVPVPEKVREWIQRQSGSRVVSVHRLPGASSTAVHAVRLADGGSLVLRRYVWEKFRIEEPEAPVREVDGLEYARRHGLQVPVVIAADPAGADVGDGIPTLLMARVPGRAQPAPDVRALAAIAARVHSVSRDGFDYRYRAWCRDTSSAPPRACRRPERWELALRLWRSAEPAYEACFIHRAFHPGNVLWFRGALTGVVDWANACVGPPGIDIATCRWNLQDWAGEQIATQFVTAYEELTRRSHHPYWDVAKIVEDDWDLIDEPERVWAAEEVLAQALPRLLAAEEA